jgi:hypothetical protein
MLFKAFLAILALFLFIASCSFEGKLNKDPTKYFKSMEYLEGVEVMTFDTYSVYRPTSFVMNGEYIYVQNRDEMMLCAINRDTKEVDTLLMRGQGPEEVLNISYITPSDDAVISVECNKRLIIEISFHSNKTEFTSIPFEYGAPTSIIKGQEGYVMLGNFPEGRYLYYNPATEKAEFFGAYRVPRKHQNLNDFTKSLIYISSKLAVKPDKSKFVAINFNSGVIDINGFVQDSIVNLKQLNFHYQEIYVEGGMDNPRVFTKRSNKNGFFDVTASDAHIYVIYSGKSFDEAGLALDHCDYLMVFDWNGQPIGCYKLNNPLYAICYNTQEERLYGIHIGEEAKLYQFDLHRQCCVSSTFAKEYVAK